MALMISSTKRVENAFLAWCSSVRSAATIERMETIMDQDSDSHSHFSFSSSNLSAITCWLCVGWGFFARTILSIYSAEVGRGEGVESGGGADSTGVEYRESLLFKPLSPYKPSPNSNACQEIVTGPVMPQSISISTHHSPSPPQPLPRTDQSTTASPPRYPLQPLRLLL